MDPQFEDILRSVSEVASGLHGAGAISPQVLAAIVRHAGARHIRHSAETGSGASTLLLSHLSEDHTVFATDSGGSISNIRGSPLLRKQSVTFVEGPTQLTLPQHAFAEKLQLVLIDGPHGYPFPDLEYYHLYPRLETGALLIVDDIQIRTLHNLSEFLRRDAMFRLDEVVRTTAFFTRTEAPVFDPRGDGWWQQNYNAEPLLRYVWRDRIKSLLPDQLRRDLSRLKTRGGVGISAPAGGAMVEQHGVVEGSTAVPDGAHLWVLVHRKDIEGWWPQGGGPVQVSGNRWEVQVNYGEGRDTGHDFEIAALIVGQPTHDLWTNWVARVEETGLYPPVRLPAPAFQLGACYRTVKRG